METSNSLLHQRLRAVADQQRAEAKRALGALLIDQVAADRIVDCIIGAALAESTIAIVGGMREARNG